MKTFTGFLLALGICAVVASPLENKRLIKTSEEDAGSWLSEDEIMKLRINRVSFVDITDDREFTLKNIHPNTAAVPTTPRFQTVVNSVLRSANRGRVEQFVQEFSDFWNRGYQSEYGEQSQKWLMTQAQASLNGYNGNTSVREVDHSFRQNSIVVRIEGTDPQLKSEVVILGAHQDSLSFGGASARAPGADDNGSGSSVVLEALRLFIENEISTKRSVEFHWYAAEEQGLLGSAAVAKEYADNNVNVAAMLNFDVVGYQPASVDYIGIYTDNGDAQVTQFLRVLTDTYLSYGRRDRTCGYGCSDHASWTRNSYPAGFAAEYEWQPYMHSDRDTIEYVNFTQVMEFVKLGVSFILEVAEPV